MQADYKKYYWNRNAATHREAIQKFAVISFMATLPLNVPILIFGISAVRCGDIGSVRSIALIIPSVHLVAWLILLITMCLIYHSMVQSDARDTPPTPPHGQGEKIPVYSGTTHEYDIVRVPKRSKH